MPLTPEERARRRLHRLRATTSWAIVYGLAVTALGGAYGAWGLGQIARGAAGAWQQGFDRPLVRVGMVFMEHAAEIRRQPVTTPLEEQLRNDLAARTEWLGAGAVFLLRLLLTTMCLTAGLMALVSGLTRKETFALLEKAGQGR